MSDATRAFCLRTLQDPFASGSDHLEALTYLHRNGGFPLYRCRCFGPELSQMAEDELDALFPDVTWRSTTLDEHLNYLKTTPDPFADEEDRLTHVCSRLLSGFQNHKFNARAYVHTTRVLGTLLWTTPRFLPPQPTLDDLDPRLALAAVITTPGSTTMKKILSAMDELKEYEEISSPSCTCFPGKIETATRGRIKS